MLAIGAITRNIGIEHGTTASTTNNVTNSSLSVCFYIVLSNSLAFMINKFNNHHKYVVEFHIHLNYNLNMLLFF